MAPFGGLGIGLSLVFGCLLLALVAELYYLLWWKKRISNSQIAEENDYTTNNAKELIHLFCWGKSSSLHSTNNQARLRDPEANLHEPDPEMGTSKDLLLKAFGEEGVEAELMRLHNLAGPPRFLFTIKEETKEDLESDDGKSRGDSRKGSRTRSLSDLLVGIETPFITPLASPRLKSSPLGALDSYHQLGFNPLFESSAEAELNRFRSSPPPKFKFLRDAEEKLLRKLMEEAERRVAKNGASVQDSGNKAACNSTVVTEEKEGSFLKFIVGKNSERETHHHIVPQCPSSSAQVLPLASSPTTTLRPLDIKSILH